MKYFFPVICFGIVISFFGSCKKDSHEIVPAFDYKQAAGIWVPYEATDQDGTVHHGPFTAASYFGSYAESVQLNEDQTFIPVTWFTKDNFVLKTAETGNFEYLPGNKLRFKGLSEFEFDIIKFEVDDLWLKDLYVLWKFKRQH